MVKLVNTRDLKSLGLTALSVQVRPPAPPAFAYATARLRDGALEKRVPRCSRAEAQRRRERKRAMKYVYILQSEIAPDRYYVGSIVDLKRRLSEHNDGHSVHTNKFKPWRLKTYLAFDDHAKADAFEAFLKTGNGRAFAKKRL